MAIAAFPTEENPSENRDVVVRLDGRLAARAMRSRRNDGDAFRNAGDANIQEAADDNAEEEKEERDHTIDCATGIEMAQCEGRTGVSDG